MLGDLVLIHVVCCAAFQTILDEAQLRHAWSSKHVDLCIMISWYTFIAQRQKNNIIVLAWKPDRYTVVSMQTHVCCTRLKKFSQTLGVPIKCIIQYWTTSSNVYVIFYIANSCFKYFLKKPLLYRWYKIVYCIPL